ncbi:MAG: flagellar biosynthesis protein [Oscillospiraceae bacterium]|jgi:flagellar operon protein|nr:flagellar biosynthesis protein [Oscillospiraceae bacterium]MDE7010922.1 flagellar biosynthesis protein [Oscillospiraceae bacterium]
MERITPIEGLGQVEQVQQVRRRDAAGGFGALLRRELTQAAAPAEESFAIAFTKHARTRAQQRGIEVTPALMGQLADSVERASAKGATNILAFDATRAFIINVPHGRVITTMSQEEMQENIFTNIDGAVLLK